MIHIDAMKVAISLLNSTLGLDDLSPELHGRIATVLVLLNQQEGEVFFSALQDAYMHSWVLILPPWKRYWMRLIWYKMDDKKYRIFTYWCSADCGYRFIKARLERNVFIR